MSTPAGAERAKGPAAATARLTSEERDRRGRTASRARPEASEPLLECVT